MAADRGHSPRESDGRGETPAPLSRRSFLRGVAGSAALGLASCGDDAGPGHAGALAVTMWEFSWLVRRSGAEAEYADWGRVLDELAERGYDAIRLDAFPHLIARGPTGDLVDRFTVLPQTPLFFWGNHAPVEVEPRPALLEFLGEMRSRGMRAGLSTWFNDDATHRAGAVVTPDDYARIWSETLDHVADAGLLDVVEWVDLCNEFPLGRWAKGAAPAIFGGDGDDLLRSALPWSPETRSRVQAYLDESIGALRDRYPELDYTFSFAPGLIGDNLDRIDTSSLDLAEIHIWLSFDPAFIVNSLQGLLLLEVPGSLESHVSRAPGFYFGDRERWIGELENEVNRWHGWAAARGLPVITTEAWGPVNYDDVGALEDAEEWAWVKDVCAEGVRMAVERGFAGICTSNFCQPHFEGMWADVAWHRARAAEIRGSRPLRP